MLKGLRIRDAGHIEMLGVDRGRERKRFRPLLGSQLKTSSPADRLRDGEALRLLAQLAGDKVDGRALAEAWQLDPRAVGNVAADQARPQPEQHGRGAE